jgi:hypothetical protein
MTAVSIPPPKNPEFCIINFRLPKFRRMKMLVLPEKTIGHKREDFATRLQQDKAGDEPQQTRINTNLLIDYRLENRARQLGSLEPVSCRGVLTAPSLAAPCWRVQRFFDRWEDESETVIRTGEPYRAQPIRTDSLPLDRLNARCAQEEDAPARTIEPINFWK